MGPKFMMWWRVSALCFVLVNFQCVGSDDGDVIDYVGGGGGGGGQIKYRVTAAGVARPNTVYKV